MVSLLSSISILSISQACLAMILDHLRAIVRTSLAKIDSKNAVIIFRTVAKKTRRGASEYKYNRFVLRTLNGVYSPVVGSCDNKLPRRVALEWLERSSLSQIPCDTMRLPLDSAKARRWSLLLSPSLSLSLSRCA